MAIRFKASGRSGDQVLITEKLRVTVGDRVLLDNFSASIRRGDVLGLIGPNGAGKSTLLATILGERAGQGGEVRMGDSTGIASYRQDLGQVPRDKALFDIIHDLRPAWTRGQVMDHLGRYDFPGDETLRRAGSLSGGELARVALAMMTLVTANVLVFDEPTNHLDVESIEALEDAIEEYEGSVILVSHDRALLRGLCTRVWHLEHAHITDYEGNFEEWEAAREERRRVAASQAREEDSVRRAREKKSGQKGQDGRKAQQSEARTAKRALQQAEARVHALEARSHELDAILAKPELYQTPEGNAKATGLALELETVKLELETAYTEWEAKGAELEKLEN